MQPKQYNIQMSMLAQSDISKAVDYIDNVLCNPHAADNLLDEIDRKISYLKTMPDKYALAKDMVLNGLEIRFIQIKKYLLFYIIYEESSKVVIIRFLHSRQDWNCMLF